MEQLIFVGVIVVFSIFDMLARARRARGSGSEPSPEVRVEDAVQEARGRRMENRRLQEQRDQPAGRDQPAERHNEPFDLLGRMLQGHMDAELDEARGNLEPDRPPPGLGTPVAVTVPEHFIHGSHVDFHTDPSERAPTVVARATREARSPAAEVARELLRGGRGAARRAVILNEVLSPPVSLREPRGDLLD